MISVIIPAFNEEKLITQTAGTVARILRDENIPYELLFVDDGSADGTWDAILSASRADPKLRQRIRHVCRTGKSPWRLLRGD